eukprot:12519496-Prorocentrum_lima.AAC.1
MSFHEDESSACPATPPVPLPRTAHPRPSQLHRNPAGEKQTAQRQQDHRDKEYPKPSDAPTAPHPAQPVVSPSAPPAPRP